MPVKEVTANRKMFKYKIKIKISNLVPEDTFYEPEELERT